MLVMLLFALPLLIPADAATPTIVQGQTRITDSGISAAGATFTDLTVTGTLNLNGTSARFSDVITGDPKGDYDLVIQRVAGLTTSRYSNGEILLSSTNETTVLQQSIAALAAARGGRIYIRPTEPLYLNGTPTIPEGAPRILLEGGGPGLTILHQMLPGADGLRVGGNGPFDVRDLTIRFPAGASTGHGISAGGADVYGWTRSRVERVHVENTDADSWGIRITNPGWLTIQDVRLSSVRNGLAFVNNYTGSCQGCNGLPIFFGNNLVENLQVDMVGAGTGVLLDPETGWMNLNTFLRLHIFTSTYTVGSVGVHLKGEGSKSNQFYGFNIEAMDTDALVEGTGNAFVGGYMSAGGETYAGIHATSSSRHNIFSELYIATNNPAVGTGLRDLNTNLSGSNTFENIRMGYWKTPYAFQNATRAHNVGTTMNGALYTQLPGSTKLTGSFDFNNQTISNLKTITIKNQGAGPDPTITSSSAVQNIQFSGGLVLADSLYQIVDSSKDIGTSTSRWNKVFAVDVRILGSAGDAQPASQLTQDGLYFGAGGASAPDARLYRDTANRLSLGNGDSLKIFTDSSLYFGTSDDARITYTSADAALNIHATTLDLNGGSISGAGSISSTGAISTTSTVNGGSLQTSGSTRIDGSGNVYANTLSTGIIDFYGQARDTCSSSTRGKTVWVEGTAGVADQLYICRKDAADAYAWNMVSFM